MGRGGVSRPILIMRLSIGPLSPLASARQPSFFTSFKGEGWPAMCSLKGEAWSGREDLNLRLPAPKAGGTWFKNIDNLLKILHIRKPPVFNLSKSYCAWCA